MCGCMKIWTINNFIYFYTLHLYSESCGPECDLRTSSPIVCKKPRLVDTQDTSEWIIAIIFNKYKTFSVLISRLPFLHAKLHFRLYVNSAVIPRKISNNLSLHEVLQRINSKWRTSLF